MESPNSHTTERELQTWVAIADAEATRVRLGGINWPMIVHSLAAEVRRLQEAVTNDRPRRWRHKHRGAVYTEICQGVLLDSIRGAQPHESMVIYRGDDGKIWVRPAAEFHDGPFEEIEDV